jgi:hypothetical protein
MRFFGSLNLRVSHRIIQGNYSVYSPYVLSSFSLPLPPTCVVLTVSESRSNFASTIRQGFRENGTVFLTVLARTKVKNACWRWENSEITLQKTFKITVHSSVSHQLLKQSITEQHIVWHVSVFTVHSCWLVAWLLCDHLLGILGLMIYSLIL